MSKKAIIILVIVLLAAVPTVIIAGAVVVTMMVTGKVSQQEKEFQQKQAELEAKMNQKGRVVYTIKDVPEGQVLPPEALEEREIEESKIPQDAVTSTSEAAGRIAKYGISKGQIVSTHDLTGDVAPSKPSRRAKGAK